MTPKQIRDAINVRVNSEIKVAESIVVQFDNFEEATPDNALWVRANILEGESAQKSIGVADSNTTRNLGILILSIFVPKNSGTEATSDMIQVIRTAFKPGSYSGVKYRTSTVIPVGNNASGYQTNVAIPYLADELV